MQIKPQLNFRRFEFKYLLSQDIRHALENDLRNFVEFDPFVKHANKHRYFVRSLYFDDPHFTAYYDKVDGVKKRSKFRLRTYTNTPGAQTGQFLEIKGRYNQLVFKQRTQLPTLSTDKISQQLIQMKNLSEVTKEFFFEYYRKSLAPVALIDYWRRPYICKYNPDFRLTFDTQLRATQTNTLSPKVSDRSWRVLPGYSILEIKFKEKVPAWFHCLIQSYQLQQKSISKICHGLETLKIVKEF